MTKVVPIRGVLPDRVEIARHSFGRNSKLNFRFSPDMVIEGWQYEVIEFNPARPDRLFVLGDRKLPGVRMCTVRTLKNKNGKRSGELCNYLSFTIRPRPLLRDIPRFSRTLAIGEETENGYIVVSLPSGKYLPDLLPPNSNGPYKQKRSRTRKQVLPNSDYDYVRREDGNLERALLQVEVSRIPYWDKWKLNTNSLELVYHGDDELYSIDLESCISSAKVLDCIYQISSKQWANDACIAGLIRAIDDILEPQANLCSWGSDSKLNKARIADLVSALMKQR